MYRRKKAGKEGEQMSQAQFWVPGTRGPIAGSVSSPAEEVIPGKVEKGMPGEVPTEMMARQTL